METLSRFITKECEKTPLSDVVNVVMRLGKSLGGKIDIN
jgi:hypothetical protein